jgi:hypothetical protein
LPHVPLCSSLCYVMATEEGKTSSRKWQMTNMPISTANRQNRAKLVAMILQLLLGWVVCLFYRIGAIIATSQGAGTFPTYMSTASDSQTSNGTSSCSSRIPHYLSSLSSIAYIEKGPTPSCLPSPVGRRSRCCFVVPVQPRVAFLLFMANSSRRSILVQTLGTLAQH